MKLQTSSTSYAFLTVGSLLMTVLTFSGIFFLKEDVVGRLIVGLSWSLVTLGWLGQLFHASKKDKTNT